jgi:hypothetical protein
MVTVPTYAAITYDLENPQRPTIDHDHLFGLIKYSQDWGQECESMGVTIVAANVLAESPLMVGANGVDHDTTTVTAWLEGGAKSKTLRADFQVTFSDGQKDSRSIFLKCKDL